VSYCKYAVETKRFLGSWCRGAIWGLDSGDFREFLGYINGCDNHAGVKTRIRRIWGDVVAKYHFPKGGLDKDGP
jgi:hypothetical protein